MLYSTIFLAASAFSGLAAAQSSSSNSTYSVDPNSVSLTTRQSWCRAETNTCPVLCGNSFRVNSCDANTLQYACTCNNGLQPDLSQYQNTIAAFECNEYKGQCLSNNAGNATAQRECQQITCGTQTASNLISSTAASTSSASSSASSAAASVTSSMASSASSASGSAATASATGAANAVTVGSGAFAASLFGLVAYVL